MELISHLAIGFEQALSIQALTYCFLGVVVGTIIGVLPGLGPTATIAMLLPLTFGLPPTAAAIMLAGIYYGAQYGGSTSAILVNLPGEPSAVVTAIEGHQLALKGRAGVALFAAALGSFVAGTIATCIIAVVAQPLADFALQFGPAEYAGLSALGLAGAVALARGSVAKAMAMVILGLLLGTVGRDVFSGTARFTFGLPALTDGISIVALGMGVFGLAEIIRNLGSPNGTRVPSPVHSLLPKPAEVRAMIAPIARGTLIGSALGVLPGGGAVLGALGSYSVEKRISAERRQFGSGAVAGVAAPEAANNAAAQTSFIPMLSLGIPANPVMALMIGAFVIHGIVPGPAVIERTPEVFWGLIASMWIGNVMLLGLNLPLIGMWAKLAELPYHLLFPAIVAVSCIGVYSIANDPFDVLLMAVFGALGYVLLKLDFEPAPLIMGFVLAPLLEENLRRALILSRGDATVFVNVYQHPIAAAFVSLAVVILGISSMLSLRRGLVQD